MVFYFHKKINDSVKKGDTIADVFVHDTKQAKQAVDSLQAAIEIGKSAQTPKLIRGRL